MQTIAEKIKKILEKAASTEHEGEASVLIEHAQRLMEKHQLELWQVETAGDPVGSTFSPFYQSGPSSYKPMLRRALGQLYGCTVVRCHKIKYDPKLKNGYVQGFEDDLMGPESARVTTDLMIEYVWAQVNREAGRLEKQGYGKRGALVRQIANALNARIWTMIREQAETPEVKAEATKNALVVKMRGMVEAFRDEKYPELTKGRSSSRKTSAAAKQAAAGISLNRQATSGKTLAIGR